MSWDIVAFREKLEGQHTFPGVYIFKFIVPKEKVEMASCLWTDGQVTTKPSSKGNYVSVTIHGNMASPDEVIEVYHAASRIEGLIAL